MAGLFNALNAARTSLEVNQKSIEIVGNNISNVNTEGYSRQHTELTPYPAVNFGDFFVGNGVKVENVRREHDVFLTDQIHEKSASLGFEKGQARSLKELERVFAIKNDNIATDTDKFFDSWQELAASPADLVLRDTVIQWGNLLGTNFKNTINEIDKIESNINDEAISKIDDINSQIAEIAELNERIFNIEINGQHANSARDQRDTLAKSLAQSIGAQNYEDNKGMMAVQLPGGLPLVAGNMGMEIEAATSGADLEIKLHAAGTTRTLNDRNLGGEMAGLFHVKNTVIPEVKDELDQLAYTIAMEVNAIHGGGTGLNGTVYEGGAGLDGQVGDFFNQPPNLGGAVDASKPAWYGAARDLSVAITKAESVAAGAKPKTAGDPAAPGDNTNALTMSNLGETVTVPPPPGTSIDTFNSFYGKLVARMGLAVNHNELQMKGAQDAMVQLENANDGMVGVSLEEEMISLIQYQRGFESSAKFLSTVDELMNSLINIK
ncbi:MAG: flagellar hook-associated protein FlgK [Deltaproteobacteria bacterium]|nr:MAG: flagellar hook-associated protein FlgK [Deltaproteobacteria bacterium]